MEDKYSDIPKGLKQIIEEIKKGAEAIGLLDFLFQMLFNTKIYDANFQKVLENPRITFFYEFKRLIKETYKKDKEKADEMISTFLKISAIKSFRKSDTRKSTSTMIMDEEMLNLQEYFKNEELSFNTVLEFILSTILSVDERTKKLLKIPRRFKLEAENIVNQIKNHYETTRYILGLILALFDILEGNLNENLSWYFSMKKSPLHLYYPPKRRYGSRYWLKDYLFKNNKYSKKFSSLRYMFEDWIFKELRDIRIYKAHREIDTIQDKLYEGKYKIEIAGVLKEFTLKEIDDIEYNIFILILWTKYLVARQYYSNNEDLVNYLLKSYLP